MSLTDYLQRRHTVAVATITRVASVAEGLLLRRSLILLTRWGVPVAVADAGTRLGFTRFLRQCGALHHIQPKETGLIGQVKASVKLAARFETPFILYTEPDKELFFTRGIGNLLGRATDDPNVGVVLASRSDSSFETFPPTQRRSEDLINHLCGQLIGDDGDYSYGPFLMNRALLPLVADLHPTIGWGWRPFIFLAAHRRSMRVVRVIDDYRCPPQQSGEDEHERAHRLRQLRQNILGVIASTADVTRA